MAKYMILFKSNLSANELMNNSTPDQVQASMNEWIEWKDKLDQSIGFEWGLPLQTTSEITTNGVEDGHSPISGYATMEGEKYAITTALTTHPHLKREGASIDLLEMVHMPGV